MNFARALIVPVLIAAVAASTGCRATPSPPPLAPVEFTLTNHNGQMFEVSSLRGKVVLVFFGYTMCPDACPTTLSKLSSAFARLSPDERERVKVLYVTVDPERDTAAVMKEHLVCFGVDAIGLTGSADQIRTVADVFGVFYERSPSEGAGGYSMSHTASVFGLDSSGRPARIISYGAAIEDVLNDVRALLALS